ncbi:hypothetical protein NQZ68_000602 [Dissostichus eleginoides]|nr:hypothetical protein NQZ68_000602 [Dissostichus eleginoides]
MPHESALIGQGLAEFVRGLGLVACVRWVHVGQIVLLRVDYSNAIERGHNRAANDCWSCKWEHPGRSAIVPLPVPRQATAHYSSPWERLCTPISSTKLLWHMDIWLEEPKLRLHEHEHILSAFEFQKAWYHNTVMEHIRHGFGECVPEDADSEEEKDLSTAAGSTDKDNDEDHCVIPAVTRSCVTTRAALRNTDPYPNSNNGEGIPGTGSDDADTNDPATSGRKRRRESQGVDGSPGTSSQTTGWLARDGNPGTSGYDYSSYLNLVSTLSQESSDDEEFNKAIIASMESEELEESKAPLLDYLANAGCLRPVHSDSDRELLVKDIVMFQVVHRVQVRKHPDSFKPLFCYEEHLLSADQMDNLFIIQLSPEGSNKRTAEETVVTYWRDYLQDAEEEEGPTKVQKILTFATGASVVPPIGFSPTPSVEFIQNGEDDFASTPLFPIANTCVNCIRLPLHVMSTSKRPPNGIHLMQALSDPPALNS